MLSDALAAGSSVLLVAGPGYGKTMALEEAIARSPRAAGWVACADARGESGRLLIAIVDALRASVPGLTDVVADRLAAGVALVDVPLAGAALLDELQRLLVEPVVLVLDDAEELEASQSSLALVDQLLNARGVPLALAIASRRPLRLRLSKLRAGGRLVELGPAELSFSAAECEELLRLRHGRPVNEGEVEAAVMSSRGWPIGVALGGLNGGVAPGAMPHQELFAFLAEEVLDGLEPEMRSAMIASSLVNHLTAQLAEDLGLGVDFPARAAQLGLFPYHPLLRAFLLERLQETLDDDELADLRARAAASLAASGSYGEAIDHWLAAGHFEEALTTLASNARMLIRTSPKAVSGWLECFPRTLRERHTYLLLEGHLLWAAGRHEEALEPTRRAADAYRLMGEEGREWIARLFLVDTMLSLGKFDELADVVAGWEDVRDADARETAAGVAWYEVISLVAGGRIDDAQALAERLRAHGTAGDRWMHADALARVGIDPAAGRSREALTRLYAAVAQLERYDRYGSLPYLLAMVVLVLRDLGESEAALQWLDRCERESENRGLGFVARDCQLQRAFLLARRGKLSQAELELARAGPKRGTGWRGVHRHEAEAQIAALRGDGAGAVEAAQRALERVRPGALCYRVWTAVRMAPLLAGNGAPELARRTVDETLAVLDAHFVGDRGSLHRARLLAARACLEYDAGAPEAACQTLRECFAAADAEADQIVRVHWPRLQPVLWHALAEQALDSEALLPAMQSALPNGQALLAMVDHPDQYVRRSALLGALSAAHPAALARLGELAADADPQVTAAATAAIARLRGNAPALRFELLGGFRVRRAGWELAESEWKRPMAARVVRFLLIQEAGAVPEDALFEAFWPDRPADAARQHLTVAVSRARRVLDLPGGLSSVIEARERTYRLRLREGDTVDTREFQGAARRALTHGGRRELERAADLWTGEPLPEDSYSSWSSAWRERLIETYSQVLDRLAESYERSGEHHEAARAARALLAVEPLNEGAHRRLMVAYARAGRSSHALRQYLECRRALVVELGVEPSAETARLQAQILDGRPV